MLIVLFVCNLLFPFEISWISFHVNLYRDVCVVFHSVYCTLPVRASMRTNYMNCLQFKWFKRTEFVFINEVERIILIRQKKMCQML